MHEIFLPMVAESIASIYRRSVNATFREAVEDCLEVSMTRNRLSPKQYSSYTLMSIKAYLVVIDV